MKKIILLFAILFATTSIGQEVFNTQVQMNQTPNNATPDSLVTKNAGKVLTTTSIADLSTVLGIGNFLENVVEDTSPELGGQLNLNNFSIVGTGDVKIIGDGDFSGTLDVEGQTTLEDEVFLEAFPSARVDGVGTNYLFTDGSGNLQSGTLGAFASNYPTEDIRVIPSYMLPNSTQDIVIEAKNMNVVTTAQFTSFSSNLTINSQEIELNEFGSLIIRMNVTSNAVEGDAGIDLNNGLITSFPNAFSVINGTVSVPIESDWSSVVNLNVSSVGQAKIIGQNITGTGRNSSTSPGPGLILPPDVPISFVIRDRFTLATGMGAG